MFWAFKREEWGLQTQLKFKATGDFLLNIIIQKQKGWSEEQGEEIVDVRGIIEI